MNKKIIFIVFLLLAATLSLLLYLHHLDASPKLRVVFFDVGQGDSILITTPAGQTILVDGGEGDRILSKMGKYLPFYQKKINYMILIHPHADHLEGLVPVLKKYQVEQILYSGASHTTPAFFEWLELIKDKNIPLKIIDHRQTLILDSGVRLNFLYPDHVILNEAKRSEESLTSSLRSPDKIRDDEAIPSAINVIPAKAGIQFNNKTNPLLTETTSSSPISSGTLRNDNYQEESPYQKNNNLNNTSIVFKLTYGQTSFLFMGDAETPVEEELLKCERVDRNCPLLEFIPTEASGKEGVRGWLSPPYEGGGRGWLQSTVLKVAHHGSHSSTSEEFLQAVQPKIAVISVGKDNDFGHPHSRTLRRLERFGAKILRTDEVGDIEVESDGKRVGD